MFDASKSVVDVVGADNFETGFAHLGLEVVVIEDFGDAAGDGGDVIGLTKEAIEVVFDEFGNGAGADSHCG